MRALKDSVRRVLRKVRREYNRMLHGECLVLLYHRVTTPATDPQLLSVTPENFDSHLALLKQHYHVLTVAEFTEHITQGKRFPKGAVLLTFDDGYADNLLEAVPVLERYNMQALFYIATGTLDTPREFWWDAVERIVLLSQTQPTQAAFELNNVRYELQSLTIEKREQLYNKLLPALRKTSPAERDRKIDELATAFNATHARATHRAMSFDELKRMNASRAAVIGAHTHLHPSLAALPYEEQLQEISLSKKILEETLGKAIQHFSYPFGTVLDYNSDTLRIVKAVKFELVAANYPDPANRRSNPYAFPRYLVRNWDQAEFHKQMRAFGR